MSLIYKRNRKKKDIISPFEQAVYPVYFLSFHGKQVPVVLRKLTQAQLSNCGEFSLIETKKDRMLKNKKLKTKDLIEYGRVMHTIAEQSLVSPTYAQIMDMLKANDLYKNAYNQLNEARKKLQNCPLEKERRELEIRIDELTVWVDLLLPEDFLGGIITVALGINETDIKKVSDDLLFECALLAKRGHCNPVDHVKDFVFTEFNKKDFNRRAWQIYDEEMERLKQKAG